MYVFAVCWWRWNFLTAADLLLLTGHSLVCSVGNVPDVLLDEDSVDIDCPVRVVVIAKHKQTLMGRLHHDVTSKAQRERGWGKGMDMVVRLGAHIAQRTELGVCKPSEMRDLVPTCPQWWLLRC